MVRERIIEQLGDRIQPDDLNAVKAAVKSALKVVLRQGSNPAAPEASAPPQPPSGDDAANQPSTEHTTESAHPTTQTEPPGDQLDEEESQPNNSKSESEYDDGHEEQVKPSSKKRTRKVVSSDSESNSDSDSEPQPKPRRRKNPTASVQKRAKNQQSSAGQRRLDQLKKLCRQLGCPVPPGKQRGADPREKYDNVLEYLRSKGVREAHPLDMSSHEISKHRKRLAREKELEGLDVKNIIDDGGRSRRRASKPARQLNDKLPSDLSGAELSEDSESAESEGYAAPSDGSE
ncbi:AAA family ATPase [Gracilaria domingensis]|nr:AAA family ATPase [Gracilaria domingensis]